MNEYPMIFKAISATMADIGAVEKNDQNAFDKYKYRGIDAVMNALNPAMIKNKIFVVPEVLEHKQEERTSRKGELMIYSVVKVRYTFFASDGSNVEAVVVGEAMDRSDKSTNKAMSAAFKYACFQTFCIPTEEMKDADAESPQVQPKTTKEKAQTAYPDRIEMEYAITKAIKPEVVQKWLDMWGVENLADADEVKLMGMYSHYEQKGAFREQ